MIGHIKSIKMSGLSQKLSTTIANLRAEEIKASRPFRVVSAITSSIGQVPLLLSPVVAFALFQGVAAKTGQVLDATRLFAALSLIILLASPLFWMFECVLDMSSAFGAFTRIEKFLVQDSRRDQREVTPRSGSTSTFQTETGDIELQSLSRNAASSSSRSTNPSQAAIIISGASFGWSQGQTVLSNINLSVVQSQLVLLLGPVASGKSTLLKGLLGEVPETTGKVKLLASESLSWCDQTPWLLVSLFCVIMYRMAANSLEPNYPRKHRWVLSLRLRSLRYCHQSLRP